MMLLIPGKAALARKGRGYSAITTETWTLVTPPIQIICLLPIGGYSITKERPSPTATRRQYLRLQLVSCPNLLLPRCSRSQHPHDAQRVSTHASHWSTLRRKPVGSAQINVRQPNPKQHSKMYQQWRRIRFKADKTKGDQPNCRRAKSRPALNNLSQQFHKGMANGRNKAICS